MKANGKHLLVEYYNCDSQILNDRLSVEGLMGAAAQAAGASIVKSVFHSFCPQGITGVVVVEESHLSIHTWPEHGYAAVDFFTCGDCLPERAHQVLMKGLGATGAQTMFVRRGMLDNQRSMQVEQDRVENREDVHCEPATFSSLMSVQELEAEETDVQVSAHN